MQSSSVVLSDSFAPLKMCVVFFLDMLCVLVINKLMSSGGGGLLFSSPTHKSTHFFFCQTETGSLLLPYHKMLGVLFIHIIICNIIIRLLVTTTTLCFTPDYYKEYNTKPSLNKVFQGLAAG